LVPVLQLDTGAVVAPQPQLHLPAPRQQQRLWLASWFRSSVIEQQLLSKRG
jgi:hypothetical protein